MKFIRLTEISSLNSKNEFDVWINPEMIIKMRRLPENQFDKECSILNLAGMTDPTHYFELSVVEDIGEIMARIDGTSDAGM